MQKESTEVIQTDSKSLREYVSRYNWRITNELEKIAGWFLFFTKVYFVNHQNDIIIIANHNPFKKKLWR